MVSIPIVIRRKKAANPVNRIVCGNKDYQVVFDFDAEWNNYPAKTARFIYAGQLTDVVFEGNTCQVPLLQGVDMVAVGVFAGDLITSTPAVIGCDRSILCGEGAPAEPSPDVYAQIMELLNSGGVPGGGGTGKPGTDGITPHIGANGNWYIGETDTGVKAQGEDGVTPDIVVGRFTETGGKGGVNIRVSTPTEDGHVNVTTAKVYDGVDGKDGSHGSDGSDGVSPTVSVSKSGKVTTLSITDKNGTKTATINDGADGSPGSAGKDGTSVTHSWSGTTLTVTSASGTSSANLKGEKGDTGGTGAAGTSVIVKSVSESTVDGGSNVVTFSDGKTITIKNGSKGSTGSNGSNGVSCTHSWNGTTLTVTSASGTSSANLKGDKGDTGATGPAYTLTAADKNTIVDAVIAALPVYNGEVV